MKVKIKDILKMNKFKGTKIISGVDGDTNKIENVNIMEVPDIINYTSKNALLFTTLYPIINDEEALENLIPNLAKNNLAGVAIKLERYIQDVPDYMIQQSNELDFPILILPKGANFSTLTNEILVELLGMKTSILEFRESISTQFQELLLTGGNMTEFVELTSMNTKSDLLILNKNMELVQSSNKLLEETYRMGKEEHIDDQRYNDPMTLTLD